MSKDPARAPNGEQLPSPDEHRVRCLLLAEARDDPAVADMARTVHWMTPETLNEVYKVRPGASSAVCGVVW